ncbi:hypothetical protein ES708_28454 [subsurface metagenome]
MARHRKTQRIIDQAHQALIAYHPMTVRQVFYRLVATHVVENTRGRYKTVCRALVAARQDGTIPWPWIEDRLRRPRSIPMWDDVSQYAYSARAWYRRNVWLTQPRLVEVWLEKDALATIFEGILRPFGVTLNVGRGYDSWTAIQQAARRSRDWQGSATILYFGEQGEQAVAWDVNGGEVDSLNEDVGFHGWSGVWRGEPPASHVSTASIAQSCPSANAVATARMAGALSP